MNSILGIFDFVTCYIDDITIASKNRDQHLDHIKKVITALNSVNLTLNLKKMRFWGGGNYSLGVQDIFKGH